MQPSRFQARQKETDPQTESLDIGRDWMTPKFSLKKLCKQASEVMAAKWHLLRSWGNAVGFVVIQKVTKNYRTKRKPEGKAL